MFEFPVHYDVLVIGAGHAGVEAALAAARQGARTLMLTQNLDTIGQMSCNPAIGGLAKGNMVREIDALGGIMGLNADATAIQCRMLNASKGPSVRGPRAQCDKKAYQFRLKAVVEEQVNLEVQQGNAGRLLVSGRPGGRGRDRARRALPGAFGGRNHRDVPAWPASRRATEHERRSDGGRPFDVVGLPA